MALQRATFARLKADLTTVDESMSVQYNPTEFSMTKGVQYAEIGIPGLNQPIQQFVNGSAETVTVDLFFDTTEIAMDESEEVKAVTLLTDRFYQLVRVNNDIKAPPVCLFSWGEKGFPGSTLQLGSMRLRQNGFKCIVESITQKFTLFSPLGLPLRATLTIKLREYQTLAELVDAVTYTTTTVEENTTLDDLASRAYNDPSRWREIADANNIADPLNLVTGSVLNLPPV